MENPVQLSFREELEKVINKIYVKELGVERKKVADEIRGYEEHLTFLKCTKMQLEMVVENVIRELIRTNNLKRLREEKLKIACDSSEEYDELERLLEKREKVNHQ